jgi:hypothetical protein
MRDPKRRGGAVTKPESSAATETLHEIESIFDRMASWVAHNPRIVLSGLAVVLVGAAGLGGYRAWSAAREAEASAEVAAIGADFRRAMGAKPGQPDIPELANAEAAAATRAEYATRLADAADRLAGTRAGLMARIQLGTLRAELGETQAALDAFRSAAAAAIAQVELGAALEASGDPAGAAEAFLAAGRIETFPGRVLALGDAARCFAEAGEDERALEVYGGLSEAESAQLPVYVAARLRELRIRTQGSPEPAAAATAE